MGIKEYTREQFNALSDNARRVAMIGCKPGAQHIEQVGITDGGGRCLTGWWRPTVDDIPLGDQTHYQTRQDAVAKAVAYLQGTAHEIVEDLDNYEKLRAIALDMHVALDKAGPEHYPTGLRERLLEVLDLNEDPFWP